MAFFLPALLLPLVERTNKWIQGKQIDQINARRVKSQLKKAAATCKQHLRHTHLGKSVLVEQFITEVELTEQGPSFVQWGQFRDVEDQYRDIEDIREKMLRRVDSKFDLWLSTHRPS